MIEEIFIKNVASFDSQGVGIRSLKKVNFIFGSNGTGKSTIGTILSHSTMGKIPNGCNVKWKDDEILPIVVYNREFRKANYQEFMPGVFTIGESSVELLSQIESKRAQLYEMNSVKAQLEFKLEQKKDQSDRIENNFRDNAWKVIYTPYKSTFSEAFKGFKTKDNFIKKLLEVYGYSPTSEFSYESLKERADSLLNGTPIAVNRLPEINFKAIVDIENDAIWNKAIFGHEDVEISSLIKAMGMADWVNQGIKYISPDSDVCPFCQSHTIDSSFREKLSKFFDETYQHDVNHIKLLHTNYVDQTDKLVQNLNSIYEQQVVSTYNFLNIKEFKNRIQLIESTIKANIELTRAKINEPSRKMQLHSMMDVLNEIVQSFEESNLKIKRHNELVWNFSSQKRELINDIWDFLVDHYVGTIESYVRDKSLNSKEQANIEEEIRKNRLYFNMLDAEIRKMESSISSIKPTIDTINRQLVEFGFTNFKIVEAKDQLNKYQLQRSNGSLVAKSLSEGEFTFVTFLYFMQLVKGAFVKSDVAKDKVLVIDDPVSSLDSNVLLVVGKLIKDLITKIQTNNFSNVKQLILLTHNVFFHKVVSHRKELSVTGDEYAYWILRKSNNISSIEQYTENPIKSSYELLWKDLKSPYITSSISKQLTMHRILDSYFCQLGGYSHESIVSTFSTTLEKNICTSLLDRNNNDAQSMSEDMYIELSSNDLDIYNSVFKKIFFNLHQEGHYNMMMSLNN